MDEILRAGEWEIVMTGADGRCQNGWSTAVRATIPGLDLERINATNRCGAMAVSQPTPSTVCQESLNIIVFAPSSTRMIYNPVYFVATVFHIR